MYRHAIRLLLIASLWLGMILHAAPVVAQSQPAGFDDRAGGGENGIVVVLHADRAPAAGEAATLTLTATPALDAPDLLIEWVLPAGVELLDGAATDAVGSVRAGESVARSRQIRLPGPGVYQVAARASFTPAPSIHLSALGVLFFTVNEDGSTAVSDIDPTAKNFDRTVETTVLPGVSTSAVRAPNDDPCVNVSGRITRWDYPAALTGSGAATYGARVEVPLRYVHVEVREEDTLFDDTYGEAFTDANGNYSFGFCDDDGFLDDELEVYIRIRAEIDFNGSDVVSVEDDGIIDDVYEFDSVPFETEGGTYTVNLRMKDDPANQQSAIMNVADAVFDAWTFWNNSGGAKDDDAIFDGEAEVHYEPGDGVSNSFYNGYFLTGSNILNNDDISIADDASDPDPWDDAVIIHEWGHMADDYYGCDDNGGGDHFLDTLAEDLELSWGEGYPDYYQAAVRMTTGAMLPTYYHDVDGTGAGGIAVDLETYDATRPANLLSEFNEMAIAAMLLDLNDNNNDPRQPTATPPAGPFDTVAHGHRMIQEVYTDPFFESNGDWFDDTCTSFVYLWSWLKLGKPADSATAEAVTKNNGRSNPFFGGRSVAAYAAAAGLDTTTMPQGGTSILAPLDNSNPNQIDPRWWKRLILVADNSASMGDSGKLAAVKTVMKESVNDLFNEHPKGVEVKVQTFNNGSPFNQTVLEGQFRTEGIYPLIDQIAPSAAGDPGCLANIDAMTQLRQSIVGQTRSQAWLYTDSDTYWGPGQRSIRAQLSQQQIRASFALLGGCSTSARRMSDVGGEEEDYLQLAADGSTSGGIVPYLLTALSSGGQFLYVNSDQLANAADILRAQLANSAGAGKWSDYVSDVFTYRWDRLEPREYQWMPSGLLHDEGQLPEDFRLVNLPAPFNFYGDDVENAYVYPDGYLELGPCLNPQFCIFGFEKYTNILRKDLVWDIIPVPPRAAAADANAAAPDAAQVEYGPQVHVYTGGLGINEWFIISTEGVGYYGPGDTSRRAYQVWLNLQTGEVRYLYDQVRDADRGGAVISVRQNQLLIGDPNEVVVSNQDLAGAVNGSGYKFVPAPPVPTRTYTITVDPLIERVGFLQTGYSGTFEPMAVTDPNDAPVTCGVGGVTCYTVDHNPGDRMVQYIEAPVNGVTGTWHATIDASSTQATFSFNALAASDLSADSPSKRLLPSVGPSPLVVQLGRATTGNVLTGWFQSPNGQRFGSEFTLFDDGTHGDGRAGDGRFGLLDLTPPGRGVGYLWVKGTVDDVDFERADPVAFNFQPLQVTALKPEVSNNNEPVTLEFRVSNLDSSALCLSPEVTAPDGWGAVWGFSGCQVVPAGVSQIWTLTVTPNWESAPSGQTATLALTIAEAGEGAIQGNDQVQFTRHRPPANVHFDKRAQNYDIPPDAEHLVPVSIYATDDQGYPVADGTLVEVYVSDGTIEPVSPESVTGAGVAAVDDEATLELINGRTQFLFAPPTVESNVAATVTLGVYSDTMTLHVLTPAAHFLQLDASKTDLIDDVTTSDLVATVTDAEGAAVAGALVRIGVSDDDGTQGTINGSMVITETTDASGQVKGTFTKSDGAVGSVWVRAELLLDQGGVAEVKREDAVQLFLEPHPDDPGTPGGPGAYGLRLPLILH